MDDTSRAPHGELHRDRAPVSRNRMSCNEPRTIATDNHVIHPRSRASHRAIQFPGLVQRHDAPAPASAKTLASPLDEITLVSAETLGLAELATADAEHESSSEDWGRGCGRCTRRAAATAWRPATRTQVDPRQAQNLRLAVSQVSRCGRWAPRRCRAVRSRAGGSRGRAGRWSSGGRCARCHRGRR